MVFQRIWNFIVLFFSKKWLVSDEEYAAMPPIFHMDDYDNCMLYGKDAFYCGMTFQLFPRNPENASTIWKTIEKLKVSEQYLPHNVLLHGVCVTAQCPSLATANLQKNNITMDDSDLIKKLEICYNRKLEEMDLRGEMLGIRCQGSESPYSMNIFDYLFLIFLVVYVSLVFYAWIYDIFWRPNFKDKNFMDTTFGKYVSSLSLAQNWERLLKVDYDDPDIKALSCLQGVRFFNSLGVILAHTMMISLLIPLQNPRFLEGNAGQRLEQFLGTGLRLTTLQTFFFVSSFLHAYKFFDDCYGKRRISVSYLVDNLVSRYFRLTPMIAIVSIFFATLMPHLSRGPLWDFMIGDGHRICQGTWFYNLLHLNNFIPVHNMCLGHLWSIPVDTQFYVLGLITLWLIWNYESRILSILGGLLLYHMILTFYNFYKLIDFAPDLEKIDVEAMMQQGQQVYVLYISPTTNMAGFVGGIAFGYLFYKARYLPLFTTKVHTVVWWILCCGSILQVVTFPGFFLNFFVTSAYVDIIFGLYMAISRSVFTFGVGLFIFGMTQGQGHIIRKICESPVIYVLGRLNYNAYLFHFVIQRFMVGMKRTPYYLSFYMVLFDWASYFSVTYFAAALLALFFEYPFAQIKKHVTDEIKKKNKKID